MATHSSVLAWRIPGRGSLVGCRLWGAQSRTRLKRLSSISSGSDSKKNSACNSGGLGSILGSGRPLGEGNVNPLQYSSLENPIDAGAWRATVHGVAESPIRLSD